MQTAWGRASMLQSYLKCKTQAPMFGDNLAASPLKSNFGSPGALNWLLGTISKRLNPIGRQETAIVLLPALPCCLFIPSARNGGREFPTSSAGWKRKSGLSQGQVSRLTVSPSTWLRHRTGSAFRSQRRAQFRARLEKHQNLLKTFHPFLLRLLPMESIWGLGHTSVIAEQIGES